MILLKLSLDTTLSKKKESREARVIPFDEVKEVIKNNLVKQERSKRIETWLSDERSKAKVEILE